MARTVKTHWIYGSGSHGCLYDYGPYCAASIDEAVCGLSELFEFTKDEENRLAMDLYMDARDDESIIGIDGADYCEINECDCQDIEEHFDPGDRDLDTIASFIEPCAICFENDCTDEDCGRSGE